MKKRNILLGLALAFCFTACYDLDKMPEGVLSTAEPFRSTGEIRNYIDRYYEFGVRTQGFMAGGGGGIPSRLTVCSRINVVFLCLIRIQDFRIGMKTRQDRIP